MCAFSRHLWKGGGALVEPVKAAYISHNLLTYLSYVALHRSDTTAWKSGFSVCSQFSLLSSGSPWYARHCLNNSLSILRFLQDSSHIIRQVESTTTIDCGWKDLPVSTI